MNLKNKVYPLVLCSLLVFAFTILNGVFLPTYAAEKEPIRVGSMYDVTGPTSTWGSQLPVGTRDYIKLMNKKGGINGHPLEIIEHEMGYKTPLGVEGFERFKRAGVVTYNPWGTPLLYALQEKTTEAKIPVPTPGIGRADSADGTRFPYIFIMSASYWSQATASVKFVMDQWAKEGKPGKPKIAYLYFDNPAGIEPIIVLEKLQKQLGFEFKKWAIPSPGIDQSAAVLDIVTRYKADWIISHLFGKGPSVAIKELKRNGYPMNRVVGFTWAGGEMDMEAAGWDAAEGYYSLQYAGVGTQFPVIQEIMKVLYKDESLAVPETLTKYSVGYNRGIHWIAVSLEAARIALDKYGAPLTGEKLKNGLEQIKGFTLDGLIAPLVITPEDHEGGGFIQVYQTKGGKLVSVTDWFQGYRKVVLETIKEAGQAAKK